MPSSLLQIVRVCSKLVATNSEQAVRTELVNKFLTICLQTCNNLFADLIVKTCSQTCKNLWVFTRLVDKLGQAASAKQLVDDLMTDLPKL